MEIITFSFNRPMQLKWFIDSLQNNSFEEDYDLTILWKASNENYHKAYIDLFHSYNNRFGVKPYNLHYIEEENFTLQLLKLIDSLSIASEYCLFSTDDMIFYKFINFKEIENCLAEDKKCLSYSLRLHPSISYCLPAKQKVTFSDEIIFDKYGMRFNWKKGTLCAGYPIDVGGSCLRSEDMLCLCSQLMLQDKYIAFSHVNHFEAELSKIVRSVSQTSEKTYSRCAFLPYCNSLQINRVQQIFENPISSDKIISPEILLEYYWQDRQIDLNYYRDNLVNSCHREDLMLLEKA